MPVSSSDIKKVLSKKIIKKFFILKNFNINLFLYPISISYSTFLYKDFVNYFTKNVKSNFFFFNSFKIFYM